MTKLTTAPTPFKLTRTLAMVFGGAVGLALILDSASVAFDQSRGHSGNDRCEAQLVPIAKEHDLPLNGSSRYNPWSRRCTYVYAKSTDKDDAVSTFKWFPDLNFISK